MYEPLLSASSHVDSSEVGFRGVDLRSYLIMTWSSSPIMVIKTEIAFEARLTLLLC